MDNNNLKEIKNSASYRDKTADVTVKVEKTNIKLSKKADKNADVANGDTITYTITVENPNNYDTTFDEILKDKLDKHLVLQGMYKSDGNKINVGSDGKYDADSTVSSGRHEVVLTRTYNKDETTSLQWNVGTLAANEKVTIIYKVKVDLKNDSSISSIENKVKSNHGESGDDEVKVTPQTTVDKKVKASTESDDAYNDGGQSYEDETFLDYKISITNAKGDAASTKEHHVLTDTIDAGLFLKVDKLYTYAGSNTESDYKEGKVNDSTLQEVNLTLEQYLEKNNNNWDCYFAKIDNDIVMIQKQDSSGKAYYRTKLTWYIGKLNSGQTVEKKYQVTLKMADSDGDSASYSNTVTDGGKSKTVTVNGYKEGTILYAADIKKNVWSITESQDENSITQLNNKKYFRINDSQDKYVIYTITVANTGKQDITVKKIADEYGENLEYLAMSESLYNLYFYQFKESNQWKSSIKTDYNMINWIDVSADSNKKEVTIKKISNDMSANTVTYQVGDKNKGVELPVGKTISFFVLCKVKNPSKDTEITNTAKLFVDKNVAYKDYGTIKTKGTKDNASQNNGSSTDLGVTDDQRVISSSVTVIPKNKIIPGITKEATGYIYSGKTISDLQAITLENKETNILPNSTVRWELKLYNDGTIPIDGYNIADSVDSPFHIMTKDEATGIGITDSNREANKVFLLEIYNSKNDSNPTATYDLSSAVWQSLSSGTDPSSFNVAVTRGAQTSDGKSLAIPAGGYARFTVYTNCTRQNFTIYENTATFSPTDTFDGSEVTTGTLVTDKNETATGVKASDNVYAMGEYGSFSWKTIAEEEKSDNQAVGYNTSKNYIVIDKEDTNKKVVYTNNIKNVSQHKYEDLTILDLMPFPNDTGVLNQSQRRGSEFTVAYNNELSLTVKDTNGNVTKTLVAGPDYSIQFSGKVSFTDADTGHEASAEWHDTWASGDRSFRILMNSNFELQPSETLCIQYQGLIGEDVQPGKIAWNSFGYAYEVEGLGNRLRAEPPKVGVKIQISPTITKKVVDTTGKDKENDTSKTFTFKVYEGDRIDQSKLKGSFSLYQGEAKKISSIKDENGNPIFVSGQTYTLVENVDSSYNFKSVKSSTDTTNTTENKYTFTYSSAQDSYNITFTNELNEYTLPGTGGIGIRPFLISGAALMCLAALLFGYNLKRKRR